MDIVVVLDEALPNGFFECKPKRDGAKETEQRVRTFLVILPYRRGRQAKAILEERRRSADERRSPKVVNFVGDQQARVVERLYGGKKLRCTQRVVADDGDLDIREASAQPPF